MGLCDRFKAVLTTEQIGESMAALGVVAACLYN